VDDVGAGGGEQAIELTRFVTRRHDTAALK
jgi:hypothetical protein